MTPLHRNHRETFPDFASAASGLRVLPVLRQQRRHDFRVGAEIRRLEARESRAEINQPAPGREIKNVPATPDRRRRPPAPTVHRTTPAGAQPTADGARVRCAPSCVIAKRPTPLVLRHRVMSLSPISTR
jgi:hypothetical protein